MTKPTMTFDILPIGPCLQCLEAMVDPERGTPALHEDLGADRAIWGIYCRHNRCGAFTLTSPIQPEQWTMIAPCTVGELVRLATLAANNFRVRPAAGGEAH